MTDKQVIRYAEYITREYLYGHSVRPVTYNTITNNTPHCSGVTVASGYFRKAFIFENIVVKTGKNKAGTEQCAREFNTYQLAKAKKLNRYFAKAYGHFEIDGHNFYVYQKVSCIGDFYDRFDFNSNVRKMKRFSELMQFCRENRINDLHRNNYGKNGNTYKLVDYAGATDTDFCNTGYTDSLSKSTTATGYTPLIPFTPLHTSELIAFDSLPFSDTDLRNLNTADILSYFGMSI